MAWTRWLARLGLMVTALTGGAALADDVNTATLAQVRPGDDVDALKAVMGAAWRPPAAHRAGVVDILENSHFFVARITVAGKVGEVKYTRRFDPEQEIEGLRILMPMDEARTARPDIKVGDKLKGGPPMQFGFLRPSEGREMRVMYNFDKVYEITLHDSHAVYPVKLPTPYAEPSGEVGAPFPDKNLKLAILSELIDNKAIDIGTEEELASYVLGRPVDLEDEGYELIPEALDYLYRYPITPEQLASVTKVWIDGGSTVYPYAYRFWGGETEHFDIANLEGIALCPNIEDVDIISMVDHVDLRPLLNLKALKETRIRLGPGRFSGSNEVVFRTLRKRGVAIN